MGSLTTDKEKDMESSYCQPDLDIWAIGTTTDEKDMENLGTRFYSSTTKGNGVGTRKAGKVFSFSLILKSLKETSEMIKRREIRDLKRKLIP